MTSVAWGETLHEVQCGTSRLQSKNASPRKRTTNLGSTRSSRSVLRPVPANAAQTPRGSTAAFGGGCSSCATVCATNSNSRRLVRTRPQTATNANLSQPALDDSVDHDMITSPRPPSSARTGGPSRPLPGRASTITRTPSVMISRGTKREKHSTVSTITSRHLIRTASVPQEVPLEHSPYCDVPAAALDGRTESKDPPGPRWHLTKVARNAKQDKDVSGDSGHFHPSCEEVCSGVISEPPAQFPSFPSPTTPLSARLNRSAGGANRNKMLAELGAKAIDIAKTRRAKYANVAGQRGQWGRSSRFDQPAENQMKSMVSSFPAASSAPATPRAATPRSTMRSDRQPNVARVPVDPVCPPATIEPDEIAARRPSTARRWADVIAAPPPVRPKSGIRSGRTQVVRPGQRPTSASYSGKRVVMGEETSETVEDIPLDSDSSEDEEALELRFFLAQFRQLQLCQLLRLTVARTRECTPAGLLQIKGAGKYEITSDKNIRTCTRARALQIEGAGNYEVISDNKIRKTHSISGKRYAFTNSFAQPSGITQGFPGSKAWDRLGDLNFNILCFLEVRTVFALFTSSPALRDACSVCVQGDRRAIVPHVEVASQNCDRWAKQVWFPRILWLRAADLHQKEARSLFGCLENGEHCQARALLHCDLNHTRLQGNVHSVVALVRASCGLLSLNLSRTRLKDDGALQLVAGLVADDMETGRPKPHPSLEHLNVEECGITNVAGPTLVAAAMAMPALRSFRLGRNEIGDDSATALARSLSPLASGSKCARIERLDVSENGISGVGLAALIIAIGQHGFIQILDIGGNEKIGVSFALSSDCLHQVAEGLNSAAALRDLHLWRCGLSDAAANLLVDAQPARLSLNLAANPLSQSLRARFAGFRGSAPSVWV